MNQTENSRRWRDYYQAVVGRPPKPMLVKALDLFELERKPDQAQMAIDLGCGSGADTIELLRRGWQVLAIDNQPEAMMHLKSDLSLEQQTRLETQVATFETVSLPQATLINASYSLPFCSPQYFNLFWRRIVASLQAAYNPTSQSCCAT